MNAHWMIFYRIVFWRKRELENKYFPIGMVLFSKNYNLCNHSTFSSSVHMFCYSLHFKDGCHYNT